MAADTDNPHPLHKRVGDALTEHLDGLLHHVIRDPACGGKENIPFYMTDERAGDTRIGNVDLLILDMLQQPRIAIEIDESALKPTQVCGNFLTTALAKRYIHRKQTGASGVELKNLLFIQIVDDSKLKENTRQNRQSERISKRIQALLDSGGAFSVSRYELLWASQLGDGCADLLRLIEGFLQSDAD